MNGEGSPLAFSPNSQLLFTRGSLPHLWRVTETGLDDLPRTLMSQNGSVSAVVFSQDSRLLVTGHDGGTTLIWDVEALGSEPKALSGHSRSVNSLAFSSDNRWLATGGYFNNLTYLWDLKDKDVTEHPIALSFNIRKAFFVNDGVETRWLAGPIANRNAIGLWSMRRDDLIDLACRTAGRDLNDDKTEWQKYFPGKEFQSRCASLRNKK